MAPVSRANAANASSSASVFRAFVSAALSQSKAAAATRSSALAASA